MPIITAQTVTVSDCPLKIEAIGEINGVPYRYDVSGFQPELHPCYTSDNARRSEATLLLQHDAPSRVGSVGLSPIVLLTVVAHHLEHIRLKQTTDDSRFVYMCIEAAVRCLQEAQIALAANRPSKANTDASKSDASCDVMKSREVLSDPVSEENPRRGGFRETDTSLEDLRMAIHEKHGADVPNAVKSAYDAANSLVNQYGFILLKVA